MKQIMAFFFIALYGIALLRPVSPLVEYSLQYKYISEELCENVDKPELDCQGSCYLNKQFKKVNEENEQEEQNINIKWSDYPIGFVQNLNPIDFNKFFIDKKLFFGENRFKEDAYSNLISAPPWYISNPEFA